MKHVIVVFWGLHELPLPLGGEADLLVSSGLGSADMKSHQFLLRYREIVQDPFRIIFL